MFKPQSKWKTQQKERTGILFREYPQLRRGYDLSMMLRACYEHSTSIHEAREKLQTWYRKVKGKTMDSFLSAAESIRLHAPTILDYYVNRSTNASAESFNAKLKNFRALARGGRDTKFHLFRIAKLYGDHHSEQMNPDGVIERMRMTRKTKRKTPSKKLSC